MEQQIPDQDKFTYYGEAKKPFDELDPEELKSVQDEVMRKIRKRAWAAGSPVYYGENGFIIAEYADGRKMVVDIVNGKSTETREYEE